MARYESAAAAINGAAVEVGLTSVPDPYTSTDPSFIQLVALLNSAGRELISMRVWQRLIVSYSMTTLLGDTGNYPLPADYGRMIDQTDWNPTNLLPLGGPLSPQDWTYLVNTNLASSTVYISFREEAGLFRILPQPPGVGQVINFEYHSRYWVSTAAAPLVLARDAPIQSDDIILFEPILILKFLKLRFLEAKSFDTTAAAKQFENALMAWGGLDKSAPILNAANTDGFPYLGNRNIPETGYGLP